MVNYYSKYLKYKTKYLQLVGAGGKNKNGKQDGNQDRQKHKLVNEILEYMYGRKSELNVRSGLHLFLGFGHGNDSDSSATQKRARAMLEEKDIDTLKFFKVCANKAFNDEYDFEREFPAYQQTLIVEDAETQDVPSEILPESKHQEEQSDGEEEQTDRFGNTIPKSK